MLITAHRLVGSVVTRSVRLVAMVMGTVVQAVRVRLAVLVAPSMRVRVLLERPVALVLAVLAGSTLRIRLVWRSVLGPAVAVAGTAVVGVALTPGAAQPVGAVGAVPVTPTPAGHRPWPTRSHIPPVTVRL